MLIIVFNKPIILQRHYYINNDISSSTMKLKQSVFWCLCATHYVKLPVTCISDVFSVTLNRRESLCIPTVKKWAKRKFTQNRSLTFTHHTAREQPVWERSQRSHSHSFGFWFLYWNIIEWHLFIFDGVCRHLRVFSR